MNGLTSTNSEQKKIEKDAVDMSKSLLQTNVVKDLRKQKEKIKQRKSMLIYGTKDMKRKIYERGNRQQLNSMGGRLNKSGQLEDNMSKPVKRGCKDRMKLNPKSPFMTFWDGFMLVIIVYSCFTSMYFAAIDFDICVPWIFWVENLVTVFFTLDIFFKFLRLPENKEPHQVTHGMIALAYIKSGSLFFEVIATAPLYLFNYFAHTPCKHEPDGGSQYSVILKLFRLVRIKRIFTLLEMNRVNKLVESIFSNQTRSKKVVFSLIMKNIYSVFRLILLTVIITYFIGCIFYLWSGLFKNQTDNFIKAFELNETPGYY